MTVSRDRRGASLPHAQAELPPVSRNVRLCRCGEKYEDHSPADVKACLARYGLSTTPCQSEGTE